MENNCELCNNYTNMLEILTSVLNRDVGVKIIEYIVDEHHLLETRHKENIEKIDHFIEVSIQNKGIPTSIDFKFCENYRRRSYEFSLTVKLLKNDQEIFKLEKNHCDYEWYDAYNFNEFINNLINKYDLIISTNTDKIIRNGSICIPNAD